MTAAQIRFEPVASGERDKRPLLRSMARGFLGRCPHCREGRLFDRYLKPVPACAICGEDFTHQRADDAPPYFTMLVVGHIIVPLMLIAQLTTNWSNTTHLALWLPLTLALTLALLQPVKGAIIALQWANYMHGFDGSAEPDALH
jgi:uncharacterized protein (DUF983 family)